MDTPYSWHPGGPALESRWTFDVPLYPDELLSSWLTRVSFKHGCDPLTLTGDLWPKWRVWTIDFDRGFSPDKVKKLSGYSGVNSDAISGAFLSHFAIRLSPTVLPIGIWPWVLSLGSKNRKHLSGSQVCPICLALDHPFYRTEWRFSWHTVCERHKHPLIQRCPSCKSLIEPNQLKVQDGITERCPHCKKSMIIEEKINTPSDLSFRFQSEADFVLRTGYGLYGKGNVSSEQWFHLNRFFIYVIRKAAQQPKSKLAQSLVSDFGVPQSSLFVPVSGLALEMLPTFERSRLLYGAKKLLDAAPEDLFEQLARFGPPTIFTDSKVQTLPCLQKYLSTLRIRGKFNKNKRQAMTGLPSPKSKAHVKKKMARLLRKYHLNYEDL